MGLHAAIRAPLTVIAQTFGRSAQAAPARKVIVRSARLVSGARSARTPVPMGSIASTICAGRAMQSASKAAGQATGARNAIALALSTAFSRLAVPKRTAFLQSATRLTSQGGIPKGQVYAKRAPRTVRIRNVMQRVHAQLDVSWEPGDHAVRMCALPIALQAQAATERAVIASSARRAGPASSASYNATASARPACRWSRVVV